MYSFLLGRVKLATNSGADLFWALGDNLQLYPILNIGGMKFEYCFFPWIKYDKRFTRFWANKKFLVIASAVARANEVRGH